MMPLLLILLKKQFTKLITKQILLSEEYVEEHLLTGKVNVLKLIFKILLV